MLSYGFLSMAGENLLSTAASLLSWFSDPSFLPSVPSLQPEVEGCRHVPGNHGWSQCVLH